MSEWKYQALIRKLLVLPVSYAFLTKPIRPSGASINNEMTLLLHAKQSEDLDPKIASQFKILTCSSTSCAARRRQVGLDEFATFVGLYVRKEGACVSEVEVSETSCLGCCRNAPCVGVEHEDFLGTVALEGMNPNEFSDKVFHNVLTEEDINRVWECVEDGIRYMTQLDDDS